MAGIANNETTGTTLTRTFGCDEQISIEHGLIKMVAEQAANAFGEQCMEGITFDPAKPHEHEVVVTIEYRKKPAKKATPEK